MLWKILFVMSTSPMHILDQGRTVTAPVDYEGILKMVGASGLPLASTVTLKCRLRPDSVVVQITEPQPGAASYQGQKGGKPPLARWATASAAAAAAAGCADKPAPARRGPERGGRGGGKRLKRE